MGYWTRARTQRSVKTPTAQERPPSLTMGKGPEQTLPQRRHTTNQHVERCSTSLFTRKTHDKTTMRLHFLPMRTVTIKNKQKIRSEREGVAKMEPSPTAAQCK